MFSFFRKGQAKGKPNIPNDNRQALTAEPPRAAQQVSKPPAPAPESPKPAPKHAEPVAETKPAGQVVPGNEDGHGGIHVQELELQLAPDVEEAVMLYATGQTGAATAALNRFILDHPASTDLQPWYLLFDIYEVTGQRDAFEEMAVDFAVRFERSPPTWRPLHTADKDEASPKHPTFMFGPSLSPQDKARLEHFQQECQAADTVGLDFSKTPVPDDDAYARILLDNLTRVAASNKEVHLTGGEAFLVRLNASRHGGQLKESAWLLLLMLLQLQGKAEEFDEAALDYAVQFEMSPPSYTPPKRVSVGTEEAEQALAPAEHAFPLAGVLGPSSAEAFAELQVFAELLPEVKIDLAQVTRVDFSVVGLLMETVMVLVQAGKRVVFTRGNGMVNLLLQMVGVNQFATIESEPRK